MKFVAFKFWHFHSKVKGILKVIHDERYRQAVKWVIFIEFAVIKLTRIFNWLPDFHFRKLQRFLLDQRTTPLDTAIHWTEYVLRHNGAYHLQAPSRNYR